MCSSLFLSYATPAYSNFLLCFTGMDELMEVSFSPIAASGKPLSRCGKCHRFMKYIQVSKVRSTVQLTLTSLPLTLPFPRMFNRHELTMTCLELIRPFHLVEQLSVQ